jgi:hypothetical protein
MLAEASTAGDIRRGWLIHDNGMRKIINDISTEYYTYTQFYTILLDFYTLNVQAIGDFYVLCTRLMNEQCKKVCEI